MKMDLKTLCLKVEAAVPTIRAQALPDQNQIIVTFTNRPDVEISLLTPYLQGQIKKGKLEPDDLATLLSSIEGIATQAGATNATTKSHDCPLILVHDAFADIGRWGKMRIHYLEQRAKMIGTKFMLTDEVLAEVRQIDAACDALFYELLQMEKETFGVNNSIKKEDPLRWVFLMRQATEAAEKKVVQRIIEH